MDLVTAVQGLLMSEKYSDITLKCHDTIFKVHQAIVCTRSPVLARAFEGDFMESATRQLDLSANELSIVTAMVKYLYSDNYDDNSSLPNPIAEPAEPPQLAEPVEGVSQPPELAETTHPIVFNTKVYLIADQYDIPSLKKLAKTKYEKVVDHIHHPWDSSTLTPFIEATELLWENTVQSDRLLRDFIVESAVSSLDALLEEPTFISLMEKWGDLAVDVLRSKHRKEDFGWGSFGSKKKGKGRKGRTHFGAREELAIEEPPAALEPEPYL